MIYNPVVGFVICSDAFIAGLEAGCVLMKVRQHTATAYTVSSSSIVFATAAVGSVGRDSGGLVDAAATILMFVAMLSSLACAGEPFKTELIFSDFHTNIYLVRPEGLEPPVNGL